MKRAEYVCTRCRAVFRTEAAALKHYYVAHAPLPLARTATPAGQR